LTFPSIIVPMNITESSIHGESTSAPAIPWGFRDLGLAILLAVCGILAVNVGALIIRGRLQDNMPDRGVVLVLFVFIQDGIILASAWLFSVVRYRVGWSALGLRPVSALVGCGLSFALLGASYLIRIFYVAGASAFGFKLQSQALLPQLDVTGFGFILTFIAAGIVAPIVEEIFFRGFLYAGLRQRWGIPVAMLVSTLFFTGLHFTIDLFVPIFVLGIFLVWLYEKTGSLYPGIMLHMANNALALLALAVLKAAGRVPF
jgi:uncharacterized protein